MADAPGISNDDDATTAPTTHDGLDELISAGRIGWLINGHTAVCDRCGTPERIRAPLFRIDVQPYRQTCARCATVLHEGAAGWPELFSRGQRRDLLGVHRCFS